MEPNRAMIPMMVMNVTSSKAPMRPMAAPPKSSTRAIVFTFLGGDVFHGKSSIRIGFADTACRRW